MDRERHGRCERAPPRPPHRHSRRTRQHPSRGIRGPQVFTKQEDLNKSAKAQLEEALRLENDPYAKHRRDVLNDPDLPEPETMKGHLAAVAKKLGIKVGHDGRIIRGKDPDMRAGWASATKKRRAHFFVGYDLHIVVLCRSIDWQATRAATRSARRSLYVVAMIMVPAGTNPGPAGHDAVMKAREIAPNINEVIADRAYTVKRDSFLRPLHKEKINVVMDYPKTMIYKADPITLGKRKQPAISNCGTIMPTWVKVDQYTLPEDLRSRYPAEPDKEQRKELTREQRKELQDQQDKARQGWYADRATENRYSTNGKLRKSTRVRKSTRDKSTRPMLCPVHAGRRAAPTKAASYKVPLKLNRRRCLLRWQGQRLHRRAGLPSGPPLRHPRVVEVLPPPQRRRIRHRQTQRPRTGRQVM